MKLIYQISIIGMVLCVTACGKEEGVENKITCIPSGLGNHVMAFYPFSNGLLNDISGNNHHLSNTTTASPTSDRNGNDSCAYKFDNLPTSGEFLTTENTAFLNNLNEFSISLWYQPIDSSRASGKFESLINRDLGNSCPDRNGQWSVALYDCRKAVFGRTNSVWDNNISSLGCEQEIIDRTNHWSHLVATFKQASIEMKIYRNGVLQESSIGNGVCGSGVLSYQDVGALFLGKDYTGKIDDVILFDKMLSQQEVAALYNMGVCCGE